ncbi:MAG: 50S ribosomal protein L29 [Lentisphaerae bacterium]|nr:50S ribosomal protein L29 [Lentisphaerota bacterium]
MKAGRIREQADEEIRHMLAEARRELGGLRMKKRIGGHAEQPLRLRTLRREIARIMTVMQERGI